MASSWPLGRQALLDYGIAAMNTFPHGSGLSFLLQVASINVSLLDFLLGVFTSQASPGPVSEAAPVGAALFLRCTCHEHPKLLNRLFLGRLCPSQ